MPRWAPTLVGIAIVALAVWLVGRDFRGPKPSGTSSDHAVDGQVAVGAAVIESRADAGEFIASGPLVGPSPPGDAGPGSVLFDGAPVPALPFNAPRQLRFGVVLVSYAGAQTGANGDHPSTRTRTEAKELAVRLAATAQHDFRAAVQQGDTGSADDIGTVKVGVLEPAPEYVLFSLPVEGVGGPVDTPRGYWIVKRLE